MGQTLPAELRRYQHLYDRLAREGAEFTYVLGPGDDNLDGHYWVGAVLRVSPSDDGLPSLAQALADDLFPRGNERHLVTWHPHRVTPGAAQAARARTAHAVHCMRARARGEVIPPPPPREPDRPVAAEESMTEAEQRAAERAAEYAHNTRLKFERVYASAQKAMADGAADTALLKCKAALDLLSQDDLYGPPQKELEATLRAHVRQLSEHP